VSSRLLGVFTRVRPARQLSSRARQLNWLLEHLPHKPLFNNSLAAIMARVECAVAAKTWPVLSSGHKKAGELWTGVDSQRARRGSRLGAPAVKSSVNQKAPTEWLFNKPFVVSERKLENAARVLAHAAAEEQKRLGRLIFTC
jgi:hypothetical protein